MDRIQKSTSSGENQVQNGPATGGELIRIVPAKTKVTMVIHTYPFIRVKMKAGHLLSRGSWVYVN